MDQQDPLEQLLSLSKKVAYLYVSTLPETFELLETHVRQHKYSRETPYYEEWCIVKHGPSSRTFQITNTITLAPPGRKSYWTYGSPTETEISEVEEETDTTKVTRWKPL